MKLSHFQLMQQFSESVREGPPPVKLCKSASPPNLGGATTPPSDEFSMTELPPPSNDTEPRLKRWWAKLCIRLRHSPGGTATTIFAVRSLRSFVRRVFGLRPSGEAEARLKWHWLCFMRLCRALGDCVESPHLVGVHIHKPSCACKVCRFHIDSFSIFLAHEQPCCCRHCQWVQMHVAYMEVLR